MIKHVVWDWNGTMLDDVDVCIDTINSMLSERALPSLARDDYRRHFGFPVRNFYAAIGFAAHEDFDRVSASFIERYRSRQHELRLHDGVHDTLQQISRRGLSQHVVSAMEARMLHDMLLDHAVAPHVEHVRGLDHLNATSKVELGVRLVRELDCEPEQILLVGDTQHDHETALAMGAHCVLFAGGHQTTERLASTGADVIEHLADLHAIIDAHSAGTRRPT